MVLVFAARDGDLRDFPADGLPELRLEGLEVEDAAALLAGAGAELPAGWSAAWSSGPGQPLALLELPASLAPSSSPGGHRWTTCCHSAPGWSGPSATGSRRLPGPARTLMLVAAAEATGDAAVLLQAGDRLGAGAEALEAEAAALIPDHRRPGRLPAPAGPLGAYLTGEPGRRQAAHRALTDVLTGGGRRRPAGLAPGGLAATVGPDEDAAAALERSADRARRRGGHAAAAAALERGGGARQRPGQGRHGWPRPPPLAGRPGRPGGGPAGPGAGRRPARPGRRSPPARLDRGQPRHRPGRGGHARRRLELAATVAPSGLCTCWSRRARSPATPRT